LPAILLLSSFKISLSLLALFDSLPDDPIYDAWEKVNVMILSWISKTLSPQIVKSVV